MLAISGGPHCAGNQACSLPLRAHPKRCQRCVTSRPAAGGFDQPLVTFTAHQVPNRHRQARGQQTVQSRVQVQGAWSLQGAPSVPQKAVVELLQPQRVPASEQPLRRPLRLVQVRQRVRRLRCGLGLGVRSLRVQAFGVQVPQSAPRPGPPACGPPVIRDGNLEKPGVRQI